ncbi:MAG: family 78 glycoside hydrolase catalytic domain [Bryobacteraceae bacterium]
MKPVRLECEARSNPLGIDTQRPRLSWILESAENSQLQTAYRILVASRPELLRPGQADLWDSGEVSSDETVNLEYAGQALASDQLCFWQVQVRDRNGHWSTSETAEWTMGLLQPSDWHASWIVVPGGALVPGPLPLFRQEFDVAKPLRRALLHVSGLGQHEVTLNGAPVSDHLFAPAWSNYRKRVYYETFDVTRLLKNGRNAAGVMLGNGMYNVVGGRYAKFTASLGPPKLIFQLTLEFADGSTARVVSDSSWKTAPGPVTFSCIYGGEDYDARREISGWDQPGFDDSKWHRAVWIEAPGGTLVAQFSPPVRVLQAYPTVALTEPRPGVYVYDLGHNFSGRPLLQVHGAAGQKVRLITAELLDRNGLADQHSGGAPVWFEYTLKGGAPETWTPRFAYTGFRYVQVEGLKPDEIRGEFLHADAPRTGEFTSSSDLLNRIHELIIQAIRSNLQNVLTDCPHREKLGWLEQVHLMAAGLCYNFDLRTVLAKIATDTRDAQLSSGMVPDIAPEYVVFAGGFRDSPEWGSTAVLAPWHAWTWYGDRRPLEGSFETIHLYIAYLDARSDHGILSYGLGDWFDIGPGAPGQSKLTPRGITATAVYYQDLTAAAGAAHLLGNVAAEWSFHEKADALRAEFQRRFYDPAKQSYAGSSQTANAMPLVVGLAPAEAASALLAHIVDDVRARGNHTSAGDIGYHYVLSALAAGGRSDVILRLATEPTAPSYASQLARGATSLTEAWDANPGSSQNHFMLGHIEQWLYEYLAGIAPAPGTYAWRRVILQPHPVGDLQSAGASYDSPRGRIVCRWQRSGEDIVIDATLPPGVSGELRQPDGAVRTTLDSGTHHLTFRDFR